MKSLFAYDEATVRRLSARLKRAATVSESKRIQCVLMRLTLGAPAAQIAQVLGWSTATVHVIHSRWAKEGDTIFELTSRGGRRNQLLSIEQEEQFLAPFVAHAGAGGVLTVSQIQQALEQRLGKSVAPSTVYRLLARHGWRKLAPRPRHPKADMAAQAAFKKTSARAGPGGRTPG